MEAYGPICTSNHHQGNNQDTEPWVVAQVEHQLVRKAVLREVRCHRLDQYSLSLGLRSNPLDEST